MNKGTAESRLDGLERNYITFQVNHEKILKLENLDKTHAYFSTFLYDHVLCSMAPVKPNEVSRSTIFYTLDLIFFKIPSL